MAKKKNLTILIGVAVIYIIFWWWFYHGKNISISEEVDQSKIESEESEDGSEKKDEKDDNEPQAHEEDLYNANVYPDFTVKIDTADVKVDAPIVAGVEDVDLKYGVGHHVTTALPGDKGNIVLSGHRWRIGNNPYYKVFEDLDKLKNGDVITIYYKGKEFRYEVYEELIVDDDAVEILEQTRNPILTLYTCTPKYTSFGRLVYKAKLIQ